MQAVAVLKSYLLAGVEERQVAHLLSTDIRNQLSSAAWPLEKGLQNQCYRQMDSCH